MKFLSLIFLTLALICQISLTTIPLIFLILLSLTVILKETWVFFLAFLFGLLFDIASFKTPGISSAYMVTFLFIVLIYKRKFEIETNYFILGASFIGSFLFFFISGYYNFIIFQSIAGAIIGWLIFKLLQRINTVG